MNGASAAKRLDHVAKAKLIGIDVGTSCAKTVMIDTNGDVVSTAARSFPTHMPDSLRREQDAEDWWQETVANIRQMLDETGVSPGDIAGISLSGQGCACQPVSPQGEPLGRAMIWTDERAAGEQRRIREIFGAELGKITGNDIYDQPEPRMMWLRDHEPERYRAADCFMTTVSYLILRLTGKKAANSSDWGFHLAYDRTTQDWNRGFVQSVGLDTAKFPPLVAPIAIVGGVSDWAAAQTGLKAGTPVVAGGQDATVSALAVGALFPGQSVCMRGTTDLISICTNLADYMPGLYTTCAVLPDLFMNYDMSEVIAAGGSLNWIAQRLFHRSEEDVFDEINRLAELTPSGSNGIIFLPYLLMSTNPDPGLQRRGGFYGLSISTEDKDLCRAVMEGSAFALREAIERMESLGISLNELRATGGPTRSDIWNRITADVTGLPMVLPITSEGAAYGAALLAGLGVGIFPMDDKYETLKSVIRLRGRIEPDMNCHDAYEATYQAFYRLTRTTSGLM
jgi:xylulokinase